MGAGVLAAVLAAMLAAGLFLWLRPPPKKVIPESTATGALSIAGEGEAYVDPSACIGCHQEIYETYSRNGMGRSFYLLKPENAVEDFTSGNTFHHKPSDRHYTMTERGGEYFVRRHQTGFGGRETNVVEKRIDYVIGSGNRARSYLWRTAGGGLAQMPVTWYAEKGGHWAMSPGYDTPRHQGFLREVNADCIACHNSYPRIAAGSDREGGDLRYPAEMPLGIDCQRCHGPGGEHLAVFASGAVPPAPEAVRASIVNPARLSLERQMEVCMQCHLEMTVEGLPHALRRTGRGAFSYKPGESLADFVLHFDFAPGAGRDDAFEIAHAAYRFRKSACFRESDGKFTCTSCHNPHDVRHGEEAEAATVKVCRDCHGAPFERLVQSKRHTSSPDCLGCHMPKRRADDVVHAVMTDHYIQRRRPRGDLLAEREEVHGEPYRGEVALYYPEPGTVPPAPQDDFKMDLDLAVAQVSAGSNLEAGIPRLEAAIRRHAPDGGYYHAVLADAYRLSGRAEDARRAYEQALAREPGLGSALEGLARLLSQKGLTGEAARLLLRAMRARPDSAQLHADLGLVRLKQGRLEEARAELTAAVQRNPDSPEAHSNLGGVYVQLRDSRGAEEAFREAIRLRPDYGEARGNLANLLGAKGECERAEFEFRKALALDPKLLEARYNFAAMLASRGREGQAERQFKTLLRYQPDFAEAWDSLGTIALLRGQRALAERHYRKAIEADPKFAAAAFNLGVLLFNQGERSSAKNYFLRAVFNAPDFAEAHLNLGNLYAQDGDFAQARFHFGSAARGGDPAIGDAARESLGKIAAAEQAR